MGRSRGDIVRRHLGDLVWVKHPATGRKMLATVEDAMALALIEKSRRGNVAAFRLILDSLYGKPVRP